MTLSRALCLLLLGLPPVLSGCVVLPVELSSIPKPSGQTVPTVSSSYQEAVGVIHVHTTFSDGSGTVEKVARVARQQGLDFLIVTDHNTLEGRRQGKAGRYGEVLVLIDQETSVRGGGHYLVLGASREIVSYQEADETVRQATQAGGLGFIAHPHARGSEWREPDRAGITGLEIYNVREDVEDEPFMGLGPGTVLFGSDWSLPKWLDRPDRSLELWDRRLNQGERLVGIGSANAHGLRWMGLRLSPYGPTFKLVRNHLLLEGDLSEAAVYDALAKGHLFVAHDVLGDASGFRFLALRDGTVMAVMGDAVRRGSDLKLQVILPGPGEMVLFYNGQPIQRVQGQGLIYDDPPAGVYRVEVRRKGRPWIYSNPIYVIE